MRFATDHLAIFGPTRRGQLQSVYDVLNSIKGTPTREQIKMVGDEALRDLHSTRELMRGKDLGLLAIDSTSKTPISEKERALVNLMSFTKDLEHKRKNIPWSERRTPEANSVEALLDKYVNMLSANAQKQIAGKAMGTTFDPIDPSWLNMSLQELNTLRVPRSKQMVIDIARTNKISIPEAQQIAEQSLINNTRSSNYNLLYDNFFGNPIGEQPLGSRRGAANVEHLEPFSLHPQEGFEASNRMLGSDYKNKVLQEKEGDEAIKGLQDKLNDELIPKFREDYGNIQAAMDNMGMLYDLQGTPLPKYLR